MQPEWPDVRPVALGALARAVAVAASQACARTSNFRHLV